MRKSKLKTLMTILIVVLLVLVVAIAVIFMGKSTLDNYKSQNAQQQAVIEENQQVVYVASRDIKHNEAIQEGVNVMKQQIFTGLEASNYLNAQQLGSIALVDIPVQQPIMTSMVTANKISTDERQYEVSVCNLMVNQADYDVVDIRIMFPNGEDYLVIPKKTITGLNLESSIFDIQMTEDEIDRMSSAIVDAFTTTGAKLYVTKYVESSIQDAATPNYLVKPSVIDLINSDPNIISKAESTLNLAARESLDSRLGTLTKEQLEAVAKGHDIEDTAQDSVIREGTYNAAGVESSTGSSSVTTSNSASSSSSTAAEGSSTDKIGSTISSLSSTAGAGE